MSGCSEMWGTMDRARTDQLIGDMNEAAAELAAVAPEAEKIGEAVTRVGLSWSGSTLGHHAEIYYANFQRPAHKFNAEWGTQMGMPSGWFMPTSAEVEAEISRLSRLDLKGWQARYEAAQSRLAYTKAALVVELPLASRSTDKKYTQLVSKIESARFDDSYSKECLRDQLNAHMGSISHDLRAASARGVSVPPHLYYDSLVMGCGMIKEPSKSLLLM